MTPVVNAQPRRAALVAHAMSAADQAWLLQSMAPARRAELEGLLAELRALGIPPDASLLESLDASASSETPTPPDPLAHLAAHQVDALAVMLRQEPPLVTARLLRMRAWPWSDAVMARFERDVAQDVRQGGLPTTAPALDGALREAVRAALADVQPPTARSAPQRLRSSAALLLRRLGAAA